jgi:hypothetical protein
MSPSLSPEAHALRTGRAELMANKARVSDSQLRMTQTGLGGPAHEWSYGRSRSSAGNVAGKGEQQLLTGRHAHLADDVDHLRAQSGGMVARGQGVQDLFAGETQRHAHLADNVDHLRAQSGGMVAQGQGVQDLFAGETQRHAHLADNVDHLRAQSGGIVALGVQDDVFSPAPQRHAQAAAHAHPTNDLIRVCSGGLYALQEQDGAAPFSDLWSQQTVRHTPARSAGRRRAQGKSNRPEDHVFALMQGQGGHAEPERRKALADAGERRRLEVTPPPRPLPPVQSGHVSSIAPY